jgi:Cu(I)/Ag(I) efflux system membrane protein CusA/SilA
MPLTTTVEGLERYTSICATTAISVPRTSALRDIVVPTPTGAQVPLGQLAKIESRGRPDGHQERGRGAQRLDLCGRPRHGRRHLCADGHARRQRGRRRGQIKLPSGYNIFWSGQYEYMLRAQQRLMIVVPLTLLIIMLIIYLNTRSPSRPPSSCSPCRSRWSARSGSSTCCTTT